MVNSYGRSIEGSLSSVLPTFRPLILKYMSEYTPREALLILSGIAAEATTKFKQPMDIATILPIFESF